MDSFIFKSGQNANIYKSRKYHKIDEWREHETVNITNNDKIIRTIPNQYFGFCDWIKTLPYPELICGESSYNKEETSPSCFVPMSESK